MIRSLIILLALSFALAAPLMSQSREERWDDAAEDDSTANSIASATLDVGEFFWRYFLWGDTPGEDVDFGPYPYAWQVKPIERTGWKQDIDPFADPIDPILNPNPQDQYVNDRYVWPEEPHSYSLRLRWGVARSTGYEATGTDFSLKLVTAYTPSFFFESLALFDDGGDDDAVSLSTLAIEPLFYSSSRYRIGWHLGATSLFWKDGESRHGVALGLGMEMYPIEPIQIEWRVGAHILRDKGYFDVDVRLDWQVYRWIQVYGGFRGFYGTRTSLSVLSAGVMFEFGF